MAGAGASTSRWWSSDARGARYTRARRKQRGFRGGFERFGVLGCGVRARNLPARAVVVTGAADSPTRRRIAHARGHSGRAQGPSGSRDRAGRRQRYVELAVALGIAHGARLDRELIRGAVLRMLDTGRFANMQIDAEREADGVKLIVWATPRTTLQGIETSGNVNVDDSSIRDALR